ncbi:MAG TPA: hypothetical protein VMV40_05480 [Acidiferrobacter sp.]|nr:hypothetical protein [Acidiferrobacter sp.]
MTTGKNETLPEILAGLRALVAELQNDSRLGDDGIPLLTAAMATPIAAKKGARSIGAPIPTLSAVIAKLERGTQIDVFEGLPGQALAAQTQAGAIVRRVDKIWRAAGRSPLEPAMIAALERALAEALQDPTTEST